MNKEALPEYRSHKKVRAAKITEISGGTLTLGALGEVAVGTTWIAEKQAAVGGYYVVYEDSYSSYSPPGAFENGYTLIAAPAEDGTGPLTVAEAITRSQDILSNPGMTFGEHSARRLMTGLIAALEVDPCYMKAVRKNEPVFTLRGQDILAPQLVRLWARHAQDRGMAADRVEEALRKVTRMEAWTPRKYPD